MSEEEKVAWCCYCDTEEKFCDEERCCTTCGADLIVLADRHSFDMLGHVHANWAAYMATYMATELKDRARDILRQGEQGGTPTNPVPKFNREVAAQLLVVARDLYRRAGAEFTLEELSAQVGLVQVEAAASGGAE